MPDATIRATFLDCMHLRFCAKGVREFCDNNGLSITALRTTGIPVEELEALGDFYATKLAQAARERVSGKK